MYFWADKKQQKKKTQIHFKIEGRGFRWDLNDRKSRCEIVLFLLFVVSVWSSRTSDHFVEDQLRLCPPHWNVSWLSVNKPRGCKEGGLLQVCRLKVPHRALTPSAAQHGNYHCQKQVHPQVCFHIQGICHSVKNIRSKRKREYRVGTLLGRKKVQFVQCVIWMEFSFLLSLWYKGQD